MTAPIKSGTSIPPALPKSDSAPTDPAAAKGAKIVNQAEAVLVKRLAELLKGAAVKLDGMAKGEARPPLSPEEAMALMAKLTGGTYDAPQGQRLTIPAKMIATALAAAKMAQADGPLAGRALDHSVQQIRPASPGPNLAPGVPQPTDGGPLAIFAPFFRWLPRRKSWRQFKRWLEKKLLKRDLDNLADEVVVIEEEDEN